MLSIRSWQHMQRTVLRLIVLAHDKRLPLSSQDRLVIHASALVCKRRWTANAREHVRAWAGWLQHDWRSMRRIHYLRAREDCLVEWRTVTQIVRERLSEGMFQTWRNETRRVRAINAWEQTHGQQRLCRYTHAFFDEMLHNIAHKRAVGLLLVAPRRSWAAWLLRVWLHHVSLIRMGVEFAEMRLERCLRRYWEEWIVTAWTRRQLLVWLVNAWAQLAHSEETVCKRESWRVSKMHFSKVVGKSFKRVVRKWRLFTAVEKYALNLRLANSIRTWFDAVQTSLWDNQHVRAVYRIRFKAKLYWRWRVAAVDLQQHRAWKAHVRAEHTAKMLHAFQEACTEQTERRNMKEEISQDAAIYAQNIFTSHRFPPLFSHWRTIAVTSSRVLHIQRQREARLKREGLVVFAQQVCAKYLAFKCERTWSSAILGSWLQATGAAQRHQYIAIRATLKAWCLALEGAKRLKHTQKDVRKRFISAQQRLVFMCLAVYACAQMNLASVRANVRSRHVAAIFRAWHARWASSLILEVVHNSIVANRFRRLQVGALHSLVCNTANQQFLQQEERADTAWARVLVETVVLEWSSITVATRVQAIVYHTCKHECLQELLHFTTLRKCANLKGVVVICSYALAAWQSASAKMVLDLARQCFCSSHMHMYVCMNKCIHVYVHIKVCMHMCIHVYIHVHKYV